LQSDKATLNLPDVEDIRDRNMFDLCLQVKWPTRRFSSADEEGEEIF